MLNAVWVAQSAMNLLLHPSRSQYSIIHGDAAADPNKLIEEQTDDAMWIPPEEEEDDVQRATMLRSSMNGQLKMLVSRFLASAGISMTKSKSNQQQQDEEGEEEGEMWLEMVTSLSWEAAALLISRLSSFDSMQQQKVITQVLMEVHELLLNQGVTLLLDTKLTRLQRIARFSASPIDSPSELQRRKKQRTTRCTNLPFCAGSEEVTNPSWILGRSLSFQFLQEAVSTKRTRDLVVTKRQLYRCAKLQSPPSSRTFHGFLNPLGWTTLLRGASSEELKKVKRVMHYAVFAAYHLLLDTSFFFQDQTTISPVSGSLPRFTDIFGHQNVYFPVTSAQHTIDHQKGRTLDGISQETSSAGFPVPLENENAAQNGTSYVDVLDSQSILILVSSQCIRNEVICEQSHLSRMAYDGDLDVSLGRNLQDILQEQNLNCSSCGEPPEDHMYSYTHHNGNLTLAVKRLQCRHRLPGESQGKIWMWSRCMRCEHQTGITRSSPRVVLSTQERNLSFGKFLGLSFSDNSSAVKCGHSLNRDCLRFFGLGSRVAVFEYSPLQAYTACKPQQTLEFHNSHTQELLEQQGRDVLARGATFFSQVETLLEHIRKQFPHPETAIEEFPQLEEMMVKEKAGFVDSVAKAFDQGGMMYSSSVHVNWLYQDLVLALYAWDRRLHHLLLQVCKSSGEASNGIIINKVTIQLTRDLSSQPPLEPLQLSQAGMNGDASEPELVVHGNHREEEEEEEECDVRERWVWSPLCELALAYRQEIEAGCLERFQLINHFVPSHLSPLQHKQSDADKLPRYAIGPGGNVMCVSEDEISSIISRALAISEDRRRLLDDLVQSPSESSSDSCFLSSQASPSSSSSSSGGSIVSSDSEASFSSDDLYNYNHDSLLLSSSLHPEISVNGKYSVMCVHADDFYDHRNKCCPSELAYITSLSRCNKWDARGGKSKAFFAKTMDGRFIIKQINKTESQSFIKFAPDYFKHLCHSLDTGSQTCLAKILGIYQVKQIRHGKEVKIDLMVMENLLFGHNVSRTYDLKGAVFTRYIADSSDCNTVYLDQNFVEDTRVSPIHINGRTKHLLQRAIWNDTSFLNTINVMDYSLLVGVDRKNHEFVFGIIDYLRQYTWDKQLETLVKISLVVPKNVLPTVISPRDYKKRFRKFMAKYFLTVPDDLSRENPSGSSKSCDQSNCKSLQ